MLLNGNKEIDVGALRQNTKYTGGFTPTSTCIIHFWNAMRDISEEQRGLVLAFITGSTKIPLDGLDPPLQIMKDDVAPNALPRSHTCFNQLVMPDYPSPGILLDKLLYAASNSKGFQFS